MSQKTHQAIVTVGPRQPLQMISLPKPAPKNNELLIQVEWTASTPLDLHQADGGLLVNPPQVLGDGSVGTVVSVGEEVRNFSVGDKVFGFTWNGQQAKAHQEFLLAPENLLGKVPEGMEMKDIVSVPNNFVTAFQCLRRDLGFDLLWPKPDDFVPTNAETPILVWGGGSSVGQYAIQILRYYGYTNIIAAASRKHHEFLRGLGASHLVDYREVDVVEQIRTLAGSPDMRVIDCIGSLEGSVRPISQLAEKGTRVAIMLPIIVVDASETQAPEYEMDVTKRVQWRDGVDACGVRTHFYLDDVFLAKHLQTDIMPAMLSSGAVTPNRIMIVEGDTLLERAERALDLLRRKVPSAERLVWRVSQ